MADVRDPSGNGLDDPALPPRSAGGTGIHAFLYIATSIVLAAATWPSQTLHPGFDVDSSWQAGLYLASESDLAWGRDIVFPYGPLGFLTVPVLFHRTLTIGALAFSFGLRALFLGTTLFLARRQFAWPLALLLSGGLGLVAFMEPIEILPLMSILWAGLLIANPPRGWHEPALAMLAGVMCGLALLVKFQVGIITMLVLGLGVFSQRKRTGFQFVGVSLATITAGWIIAAQPIGAFYSYAWTSLEMIRGYSSGMPAEDSTRSWEYVIAGILVVALVFLLVGNWPRIGSRAQFLLISAIALIGFSEFKHEFVRHEIYHAGPFFILLGIVPLLLRLRGRAKMIVPAFVTFSLAYAGAIGPSFGIGFNPATRFARVVDDVSVVADDSKAREHIRGDRRKILRKFQMDEEILAAVREFPVHVDAIFGVVAWAGEFDWRPLPVFQSYVAYTPLLDALNVKALLGADGPEAILRKAPLSSIVDRNNLFESPTTTLAMLCRYRETVTSRYWEVLARDTNTCGAARAIGTVFPASGQRVKIPAHGADQIVYARIGLDRSALGAVQELAFKPLWTPWLSTSDDGYFQLVPATANGPLIVCLPEVLGISERFGGGRCPDAIRVTARGKIAIRFYSVTVAGRLHQP